MFRLLTSFSLHRIFPGSNSTFNTIYVQSTCHFQIRPRVAFFFFFFFTEVRVFQSSRYIWNTPIHLNSFSYKMHIKPPIWSELNTFTPCWSNTTQLSNMTYIALKSVLKCVDCLPTWERIHYYFINQENIIHCVTLAQYHLHTSDIKRNILRNNSQMCIDGSAVI